MNKILILAIVFALISFGTSVYVYSTRMSTKDAYMVGFDDGVELGKIIGTNTNMTDEPFRFYSGEIYSIELYDSFNMSHGYYSNGTFFPYKFEIYKLTMDLRGFAPDQDFSLFVNTEGTRYVTFRYSDDGSFPEPGYYQFYYLDVDIIEITHWE